MKKILLATALLSFLSYGKTEVRILEDNSVITREGDVVKITLQQTFAEVPSTPCFADFIEKYDRPDVVKGWDKVRYFFKDLYRGFTWKRCAYGLGGVVLSGVAYKAGKKAHKEHYGHRARAKVSGWFHPKSVS